MMMKKKILSITIMSVSLVMASCNWDELTDINVNPNEATVPKTSALMTNAMLSAGGINTSTTGALYAQMLANKQYTSGDNYSTVNFAQDGWYSGPLADLDKIIQLNTGEASKSSAAADGDNENQIAIAKIMMAYYYQHMTDRWGDLPFSEALKGSEGLLKPTFDTQEAIYDGIFQMCKDAVAMIDTTPETPISGDIILDGDMDMWIKFANTIRLNAALRLSEANPTKAASEFAAAFTAGVIALDNSENISYKYLNVQTYENPYYNSFVTGNRRDWVIADPLMNYMQLDSYTSPHLSWYVAGHPYKTEAGKMDVIADPRLGVYANPIENETDIYIGMPYGLTEADAGSVSTAQVSYMGDALRQQTTPGYIYTAAQVAFILAEGRLNGWITTGPTAQELYETGIKASFEQHGVFVQADYDAYLTNAPVAYNVATAQEQIITQKWVALFPAGYEAWHEWRRTGFPNLAPGQNAQTPNGQIPTRQGYSTQEASLNPDNWAAALTRQGMTTATDDLTGKVWWDK